MIKFIVAFQISLNLNFRIINFRFGTQFIEISWINNTLFGFIIFSFVSRSNIMFKYKTLEYFILLLCFRLGRAKHSLLPFNVHVHMLRYSSSLGESCLFVRSSTVEDRWFQRSPFSLIALLVLVLFADWLFHCIITGYSIIVYVLNFIWFTLPLNLSITNRLANTNYYIGN